MFLSTVIKKGPHFNQHMQRWRPLSKKLLIRTHIVE